jgi:hypothetical protein
MTAVVILASVGTNEIKGYALKRCKNGAGNDFSFSLLHLSPGISFCVGTLWQDL